jgi:hypothetical protein
MASFGCDEDPTSPSNATAILLLLPESGGLEGVMGAIVLLAGGPPLDARRLTIARDAAGDLAARRSFEAGAKNPHTPPQDQFGFAGFAFGHAKLLQAVRQGAPPEILHPGIAWELGGPADGSPAGGNRIPRRDGFLGWRG